MNHRLQLFDTPESLADSVTSFLLEAYGRGDNLLVIAKPRHREAILSTIHKHGCFDPEHNGRQRLVVMDASDALQQITRNGNVDAALFDAATSPVVERLASSGRLSIYAEVVELLAEEGNFQGAEYLEQLWNALGERFPFVLMCGYSSAHFAASNGKSALRNICRAHTRVVAATDDTLGSWLLTRA